MTDNKQLMQDGWPFIKKQLGAVSDESELMHDGVKGMKWGVRKSRPSDGIKTPAPRAVMLRDGGFLTMEGQRPAAIQKLIANLSPSKVELMNKSYSYNLKDPSGKDVGSMFLHQESPTSLNVNWVSVKTSARGNGYATAAMDGAIGLAKSKGLKTVTLEVPGNAPDAKHIYEKLGFKDKGRIDEDEDVWGGLTAMQLDLDTTASHQAVFITEEMLFHYGVVGMRWGKRKNGISTAKIAGPKKSEDKADADDLKKKSPASLSNKELKRLNERMQLERTYSDLKNNDRSMKTGYKALKGVLGVAGTAASVYALASNPLVKDIRKIIG